MAKIRKLLEDLSRCKGCGHSTAVPRCTCPRSDCACGTNHNR